MWYGNVEPSENDTSLDPEYKELLRLISRNEDKLLDTNRNELQLLFVNADCHSKGVGFAAWRAIESLHPETEIWETHTPYFEQRNIHFYINKCGVHMVEFFCKAHPEPGEDYPDDVPGGEGFCRFEKKMK